MCAEYIKSSPKKKKKKSSSSGSDSDDAVFGVAPPKAAVWVEYVTPRGSFYYHDKVVTPGCLVLTVGVTAHSANQMIDRSSEC